MTAGRPEEPDGGPQAPDPAWLEAQLAPVGGHVPESDLPALAAAAASARAWAASLAPPWGRPPGGRSFSVSPYPSQGAPPPPGEGRHTRSRGPATPTASGAWAGVAELAAALRDGTTTSAQLVSGVLARADRHDATLGSLVARFDDTARGAAAAADALLAAGTDLGPLHGIPVVVKDILTTAEGPTRAQSLVVTPYTQDRSDAAAVARLRRAGAVVVAKSSTSEFAIGAPDPDAGFPEPRCPWDPSRWPGGSSSGTAVAVAAGLVPAGLGTDSGGSVRIPAALCGVSGLKTTPGRVPLAGCVPLAPGLDTVGPLARSARDCALVFDALAGDDTAARLDGDVSALRVGLERAHHLGAEGLDPQVPGRLDAVAGALGDLGAALVEVQLLDLPALRAASYLQLYGEAFSVHRELLQRHWTDYGTLTRAVLATGAFVHAADYVRALDTAARGRRTLARLFEDVDVLVMPTMGLTAPEPVGEWWVRLMGLVFTTPWNLLGVPALSIPMGPGDDGLPLGVQIVGRPGDEATVLRVGDALQRVTPWHLARPPVGG